MATKKAKRERNRLRHEKFMEEYRRDGLKALRKDRERRAHQRRQKWEEPHVKEHTPTKKDSDCPWCKDMPKQQDQKIEEK